MNKKIIVIILRFVRIRSGIMECKSRYECKQNNKLWRSRFETGLSVRSRDGLLFYRPLGHTAVVDDNRSHPLHAFIFGQAGVLIKNHFLCTTLNMEYETRVSVRNCIGILK